MDLGIEGSALPCCDRDVWVTGGAPPLPFYSEHSPALLRCASRLNRDLKDGKDLGIVYVVALLISHEHPPALLRSMHPPSPLTPREGGDCCLNRDLKDWKDLRIVYVVALLICPGHPPALLRSMHPPSPLTPREGEVPRCARNDRVASTVYGDWFWIWGVFG